MNMLRSTILASFVVASSMGHAQMTSDISVPTPGNLDSRIVTFAYTPDVVYKLAVTIGMHTHVALGQDEELIEVPRIGDKVRWRIEGNEKNLYIKATVPDTQTSLTLGTDRRSYQFELSATSKASERVQKAVFSYPDAEEEFRIRTERVARAERERSESAAQAIASQNLASDTLDPSELTFYKVYTTDPELQRIHAYTDGIKTWIRMPPGVQDLPAVFMVEANERGKESLMPVNYTVADRKSIRDRDVIIVDRVHPVWMLQIGKRMQVRVAKD
jgi:type IV secretion system protein VirB9